jgi:hypothetical protein
MTRVADQRSRRWRLLVALAMACVLAAAGCSPGGSPQGKGDPTVTSLVSAALDLMERRTAALVEGAVPAPLIGPLASNAARASSSVIAQEQSAISELTVRRDVARQRGEAYTSATTVLTLREATVSDSRIDLIVTELTTLTYKKVFGGEPDVTAFQAEREFHFARDEAGWLLVSHGLTNPAPPAPINEPAVAGGG